jgi:hypothetical protein
MLRLIIATVLSALALALAVFGVVGESSIAGMGGHASMAASHLGGLSGSHVSGLVALGSAVAAFAMSWGQRSYIIAGLLSAAGILYSLHLGPFLGDHRIIALVGPLTGLISGHVILALGVAKAIGSVGALITRPA